MHWFRALVIILGNGLALWIANRFVPGFVVNATLGQLIVIGLVLVVLNFILKPVLTLVLGPIIVITLGLGVIIVNALILYLLTFFANRIDFLQGSIMIQTIPALIFATLIVSAVNFVIHLAL